MPNPSVSIANILPPPNPAGVGNSRALRHGAFTSRVNPTAHAIANDVLSAHPHLDPVKDGPAVLRYAMVQARLATVYEWLDKQNSDTFADADRGVPHRVLERVEKWEKQCENAEHRLAIDPYTRSKLGLVVVKTFDLAQAMSAAAEEGNRDD